MNHAVVRESQSSTGNRAISFLYNSVTVVQCVSIPGGTLYLLSVFWEFLAEPGFSEAQGGGASKVGGFWRLGAAVHPFYLPGSERLSDE